MLHPAVEEGTLLMLAARRAYCADEQRLATLTIDIAFRLRPPATPSTYTTRFCPSCRDVEHRCRLCERLLRGEVIIRRARRLQYF